MCGIVGYVGKNKNAIPVLIESLKNLEYRGYDSAGIAYIQNNNINIIKEKGKIKNLEVDVDMTFETNLGIGHTRWATHGEANSVNSHPHRVGKITLVHNGIIENYVELKSKLINEGYIFKSETDSEVAAAVIDYYYNKTNNIETAIKESKKVINGAYAFGIICDDDLENLYAVKNKSPLIIGIGDDENYIASDVPAILNKTNKYMLLDDEEYAKISSNQIKIYTKNSEEKENEILTFEGSYESAQKNVYDHFMEKEMHEQPRVIKDTMSEYLKDDISKFIEAMPDFNKYNKIDIVACGSAMHAGMIGKNLIEAYADVPVNVEIASEYRYKKLFIDEKTLVILVSQSGETADTLAALNIAKEKGSDTLAIVNVVGSTIARSANTTLYIKAGPEIAVATTKAYSAQVAMLSLIALNMAIHKNNISIEEAKKIINDINNLPDQIENILGKREEYISLAQEIYQNEDLYFLGRKVDYALSLEGSLKLKEISYMHSEAYAAGELKHGTISLIEEDTPVIGIITDESIAEKTISNLKEVKSRGAKVYTIVREDLQDKVDCADKKIIIPKINELLQPMITVVPLQMIAYETAKLRGCDIDKPKNLAKSVTVE